MLDSSYKLKVSNDWMKVYFSKEYSQFAIIDEITDSIDIYTREEFELFMKALNLVK